LNKSDHQLLCDFQNQVEILDAIITKHASTCNGKHEITRMQEQCHLLKKQTEKITERFKELSIFRGMVSILRHENAKLKEDNQNSIHDSPAFLPLNMETRRVAISQKKELCQKQAHDISYESLNTANKLSPFSLLDTQKRPVWNSYQQVTPISEKEKETRSNLFSPKALPEFPIQKNVEIDQRKNIQQKQEELQTSTQGEESTITLFLDDMDGEQPCFTTPSDSKQKISSYSEDQEKSKSISPLPTVDHNDDEDESFPQATFDLFPKTKRKKKTNHCSYSSTSCWRNHEIYASASC